MRDMLTQLVAKAPATVSTKLVGAFLAIVLLLITFGVLGLQVLNGMNRRTEDFIKFQRKTAAYRQLQHDTTLQLYIVTSALLSPNERLLESALRQLHQFRYDLDRVAFVSKDEMELFSKIQRQHERLVAVVTEVVQLTQRGEVAEALELRLLKATPLADNLERLTNEMVNRAEADMNAKINENEKAYALSRWLVIGFALGSTGLSLLMGYGISSSLLVPVKEMDKRLKQIASGDFSKQVQVSNRDEMGELAKNLNQMNDNLKSLYEKLEIASKHKSDFLANVSHEFRTPLNAIIGYSEMLMEDAQDRGFDSFEPDIRKIHASGKHLLTLINDILDLSKVEAGKMEFSPETFEISGMIREVADMVRPMTETYMITMEIRCANGLGSMYSDSTRVKQMLFNLLSNACKFSERGTVSLHVDRETLDGVHWLNIQVSDTGVGMTEQQIGKLFQPFSQAETKTTRKYGGTGLGLVVTKQFCEMMGGNIEVESSYGKGTTFKVRLPIKFNPVRGTMTVIQDSI
jgi:signal transduction histidine kinase